MSAAHHAQILERWRAFVRTKPAGITADDAAAIAASLDRYFEQGCSLDAAFGVQLDRGEEHPATSLKRRKRDAWLCAAEAAKLGETSRGKSKDLAEMFARYESGAWQRERSLDECPPNRVGRIEGCFWHALRAWPLTVKSRQMHLIVAAQREMKSAFHFQARK